jgi:hypothetical protein
VVFANTANVFSLYAIVPPVPKLTDDVLVPVNDTELFIVSVCPSTIVNVALVVGAVIDNLFNDETLVNPVKSTLLLLVRVDDNTILSLVDAD